MFFGILCKFYHSYFFYGPSYTIRLDYVRTVASPIYKKALRALSSAFERLHFKSLVLASAPESAPVSALESPRKRSESAPYELTKALPRALRGLEEDFT